jgi:esterase/lipase superfamily enzyme
MTDLGRMQAGASPKIRWTRKTSSASPRYRNVQRAPSMMGTSCRAMPVLVFPSAGGDAGEIERHGLVNACGPLLAEGRIKLYSVYSVAGQAMVTKGNSPEHCMWLLNQFHECVRREVVPAIHADLGGRAIDVIAGAVAVLCRYPDVFSAAIGMSGSYRIERFYDGAWSQDLYHSAPMQFLPGLEGPPDAAPVPPRAHLGRIGPGVGRAGVRRAG